MPSSTAALAAGLPTTAVLWLWKRTTARPVVVTRTYDNAVALPVLAELAGPLGLSR